MNIKAGYQSLIVVDIKQVGLKVKLNPEAIVGEYFLPTIYEAI